MRIAVAGDHAGFNLKNEMAAWVQSLGHEVDDLGAASLNPDDDYPDFAYLVANAVASGKADKGVVVCGSGVGASVAANKVAGARAAICHDTYSARQGVEHDDMNVLCLGARIVGINLAQELVKAFLDAKFTSEERHRRRLQKVLDIESSKNSKLGISTNQGS